jgi:hypothetical protein
MVPQIDEQKAAVVADAMTPAGKARIDSNVDLAQVAAGMRAIAMHVPFQIAPDRHMWAAQCQASSAQT